MVETGQWKTENKKYFGLGRPDDPDYAAADLVFRPKTKSLAQPSPAQPDPSNPPDRPLSLAYGPHLQPRRRLADRSIQTIPQPSSEDLAYSEDRCSPLPLLVVAVVLRRRNSGSDRPRAVSPHSLIQFHSSPSSSSLSGQFSPVPGRLLSLFWIKID